MVALESTIISHGMPYPANLQTAQQVEKIVKDHGMYVCMYVCNYLLHQDCGLAPAYEDPSFPLIYICKVQYQQPLPSWKASFV